LLSVRVIDPSQAKLTAKAKQALPNTSSLIASSVFCAKEKGASIGAPRKPYEFWMPSFIFRRLAARAIAVALVATFTARAVAILATASNFCDLHFFLHRSSPPSL
jgi:hypothetical protein